MADLENNSVSTNPQEINPPASRRLTKWMTGDTKSLDYCRWLVTEKNETWCVYDATGPTEPGTEVRCLRPNSYGYHEPCLAWIVKHHPSGRFTVDLWRDKSERVTVSAKAIVWPRPEKEGKDGTPNLCRVS